jgi:hypothetical protein
MHTKSSSTFSQRLGSFGLTLLLVAIAFFTLAMLSGTLRVGLLGLGLLVGAGLLLGLARLIGGRP